jgi:O-antigen/teichoic acid export membrane protein
MRKIWADSKTFLSLTILSTIEAQADIIILSILRNESDVGWYNAATTIAFTLTIISQAVRTSIYPVMAHYAQSGNGRLKSLYHQSIRYLTITALPMVTGIMILADQIVMLIYGINFEPTISAVRILIPVVIFMFLNVANVRLMLVNERQNNLVKFMLLSVGLNVILNILLDGIYGVNSAAFARLASTGFLFFAIYRYTVKNLIDSQIRNLLLQPIIASILMGVIVWTLRDFPLWFSIAFGFVIYIVLLWLVGGITKNDFERMKTILFNSVLISGERNDR